MTSPVLEDLEALIAATADPTPCATEHDRDADWRIRTHCPSCQERDTTHLCDPCLTLAHRNGLTCTCGHDDDAAAFIVAQDGLK